MSYKRALAAVLLLGRAAAAQTSFEDLVAQAQQHQKTGDAAAAAADYRSALKLRPDIAELWANLGFMENQLSHYEQAIPSFERALHLKPQMFAPNLFIGLDQIELKRPAAAVPYLDRAAAIDPGDPQAPLALGRAYAAQKRLPAAARAYARAAVLEPEKNRALFSEGVALLEDVEDAARTLSTVAPDSKYSQALLAKSYLEEGKTSQAAAILETLRQKEPVFLNSQLSMLIHGSSSGQLAALGTSSSLLDPLLASSASPIEPMQHADAAWSAYEAAVNRPSTPANLYARILYGQWLAEAALTKAATINPNAAQTHVLLGDIARQQQQSDAALAEYNKALELEPGDPAALLGSTAAYLLQSRPEQAIATAGQFLRRQPDDPEMNLLLAEALVSQRNFGAAQSALVKASRVRSELQPRRHALLGKVYAENGQPAAAIAELKRGAESDQDGSVHYQLARLYRQSGDTASADAALADAKRRADQRLKRASIAIGAPLRDISSAPQ